MDNVEQVYSAFSTNVCHDGYPSGGNYWSNYEEMYPDATERDNSRIWDTPYIIDENNRDRYPLMSPWTPSWSPVEVPFWMQYWFWAIVIAGTTILAVALYLSKRRKPPDSTQ